MLRIMPIFPMVFLKDPSFINAYSTRKVEYIAVNVNDLRNKRYWLDTDDIMVMISLFRIELMVKGNDRVDPFKWQVQKQGESNVW